MQRHCYHCHKPFAMNKEAIHAALDTITSEGMNHFNVFCPHCRRANRISREELLRSAPDWQSGEVSQEEAKPA